MIIKLWFSNFWMTFFICACICFFSQCREAAEDSNIIRITAKQAKNSVEKLSDIVSDIDFMKLQDGYFYPPLAQGSVMLDASGVTRDNFKIYPDRFLVLNAEKKIDVYDGKGNYLFQFGIVGRGAKEYISVGDFCYNPYSRQYAVADMHSVLVYDSIGNFVKRRSYGGKIAVTKRIEAVSSSQYMIAGYFSEGGQNYAFFAVDTSEQVDLQSYFSWEMELEKSREIESGDLIRSENRLIFQFRDSLFVLQRDLPVFYTGFDFRDVYYFNLLLYRENDDWKMAHVWTEKAPRNRASSIDFMLILQSKNRARTYLVTEKTVDDCFLGIKKGAYGFVLDAWDFLDERLAVTLTATDFKEMVDHAAKNPEKYPYYEKARKLVAGLNEDSNNIIAWVTLKE